MLGGGLGLPGVQAEPAIDLAAYQAAPPVTGTTEFEHFLLRYVQANPNLINNEQFINGFANRGCTPEAEAAGRNEISRFQYLEQVKSRMPAYAARAAALSPEPVKILVESRVGIGQYDF